MAEESGAARILTAALLGNGLYTVDAMEHGEDAVLCARTKDYDIIVLDIEMPVMDGVSAAKEIRALGGDVARTSIVAFSAFLAPRHPQIGLGLRSRYLIRRSPSPPAGRPSGQRGAEPA